MDEQNYGNSGMSAKPRPNFLFIITDQQRADHVGCYGNEIVKTPAIDSLAKRGLRFDNLFVATPVCMPNRASIMTGRMPSLHGGRHNGIPLARDHVTFVELLRDAGYRTALIGKSHLQSVTGIPSPQRFASRDGYRAPSEKLQDAYKNNRSGADYELENMKRWDTPLAGRTSADFYGFTDIEIVADHADAAGGDYLLWARDRHSNFDQLVGQKNALADDRIHAPQCWRTAVPEELYSTTYVKSGRLRLWIAIAKIRVSLFHPDVVPRSSSSIYPSGTVLGHVRPCGDTTADIFRTM